MWRYALATNYIQLINKDKNKGVTIYIDGRPKASDNITGFINSTRLETTNKQPNFIYEGHEENWVALWAIKKYRSRGRVISGLPFESNRNID
jgi:hypothetical protein